MSNVKRVYVEKKSGFDVQAKELKTEIRSYLGIKDVDSVRVLIRYDVENVSDETFEKACNGIFSEPPVDTLYKEEFQAEEGSKIFSVEFSSGTVLIKEQIPLCSVFSLSKKTSSR